MFSPIAFFQQEFGSTALSIEYLSAVSSQTDTSSYTFTGISTGGPGLIVCAIHAVGGGNSRTITSCVIGGVTSSAVAITTTTTTLPSNWIQYSVCTGSSIDITVNFSAAMLNIIMGVWKITNYTSSTPVSWGNVGSTTGVTALNISNAINASSVGIVMNSAGTLTSSYDNVWSGTGLNERYDTNTTDTNRIRGSVVDYNNTSVNTSGATCSYLIGGPGGTPTSIANTKMAFAAWQ